MSTRLAFDKAERGFKEVRWIAVKDLSVIWAQAQRPLDEKHAARIAENFDPEMFGVISVTKPNGHGVYHVIDGHHRKVAIEKIWGAEELVPCQVYDAEDPARAAKLFDHINTTRKNPSGIDIFRVRVTAKEEVEMAVNKIVLACGYQVGYKGPVAELGNSISCVAALKGVYQSCGSKVLTETLQLLAATWGVQDNGANQGVVVRGVGEFLAEHRNVDFKRLREVLGAKYTPSRLHGAAKSYRELHGGAMSSAIKALIFNTYNDRLRSSKKLEAASPDKVKKIGHKDARLRVQTEVS